MEDATAPIHVILNPGSGHGEQAARVEPIEAALRASGRPWKLHHIAAGTAIEALANEVAAQAARDGATVVVAGGDGTISTVANALLPHGVALGVVPEGTFNLLAREHDIPQDPRDAIDAVLEGRVREVQAGSINGRAFFVNASIGWYPQLLADREDYKRRLGRNRLVAVWAAIHSLLREIRPLDIEFEVDGTSARTRTPTLFVGNNRLQLARVGFDQASEVEHGRLLGLSSEPVGAPTGLRLLAMGALGRLDQAREVRSTLFRRLTVSGVAARAANGRRTRPGRRSMTVALDGELHRFALPLCFEPHPRRLRLLVPASNGSGGDERR